MFGVLGIYNFGERYCFLEMMHSGTLLSKAEYSLMDRWFQFASEYYKKYVQPDVIGKTNLYRVDL